MSGRHRMVSWVVLLMAGATAVGASSAAGASSAPLEVSWEVPAPPSAPVNAPVAATVELRSVQPLHDVAVTFDATGPARVSGPATQAVGDVSPGTARVGGEFTVTAAGTGSIRATVRGVTDSGTPTSAVAIVYFATGAGRAAVSANSAMDAAASALAFERPKLGEREYRIQLEALLGSGASERFESTPAPPSAAPAPTTVQGTIRYTAVNGNKLPARTIVVEIRDADGTPGGVKLAERTTDVSGAFTATLATLRNDGKPRKLFVRAYAAGAGFGVFDPNQTDAQHIDSKPRKATGATQTVDLTANKTDANNTAFSVADMLTSAVIYTKRVNGNQPFPTITVSYPDEDGTNFDSSDNTARIKGGDRFDWDVVLHEYGHFAASRFRIDSSPGGQHSSREHLADRLSKSDGIRLAWSEGFATWFGLTAENVLNVASMGIPRAGDSFYDDTEDQSVHQDLQTTTGPGPLGEDNEMAIARFLWHTRLDAALNTADTAMIKAMKASQGTTFSEQLPGIMEKSGAAKWDDSEAILPGRLKKANEFGCLSTRQAISPQLTKPADATMVPQDTPVKFAWTPNGAGTKNRLDQFVVQFWSENWDTKLFESGVIHANSYTPSAADWKTIMEAKTKSGKLPAKMNVVVVGVGSHAPQTGRYKSCKITIAIGPGIKATPVHPQGVVASLPTAPACSGSFPPEIAQFRLDGDRMRPNKKYTLELNDPDKFPKQNLGIFTADANGNIEGQVVTIPKVPGNPAWPLTATPGSGMVAKTNILITWTACLRVFGLTQLSVQWGGAGVKPGSVVTQKWNGAATFKAVGDVSGGYGGTYTLKCPAQTNTVTTNAKLFSVPSTTITFTGVPCQPEQLTAGPEPPDAGFGASGWGGPAPDDASLVGVTENADGSQTLVFVGDPDEGG